MTLFLIVLAAVSHVHAEDAATVVTVSGAVEMSAPGVASKALAANDKVPDKAVVKTKAGSSVKLLFTDDSVMDIGPESEFKIEDYQVGDGSNRKGIFSLAYGSLRSLVSKPVGEKGSYKVKTRDAIMGVRGTEFAVSAPYVDQSATVTVVPDTSSVVVASGTVAVSSAGAPGGLPAGMNASVGAGQSFSVGQFADVAAAGAAVGAGVGAAGASVQPQTVGAAQAQAIVGQAAVSDNSFVNAVAMDSSSGGTSSAESSSGPAGDGGPATGSGTGAANTGSRAGAAAAPAGRALGMGAATGAVAATVSVAGGNMGALLGNVVLAPPPPTAVGIGNVITAPPVNILPGSTRTITVIVQ